MPMIDVYAAAGTFPEKRDQCDKQPDLHCKAVEFRIA
jgi:hypothetical protein